MDQCVVAFIDILGFKQLVKDGETEKIYKSLSKCKRRMESANRVSGISVSMFSDCICISSHLGVDGLQKVLKFAGAYARELLNAGILFRGGVTVGDLHHEDDIVFGNGLIEAHRLENEVARYPRIVLSNEIVEMLQQVDKEPRYGGYSDTLVTRADDGIPFLNVLATELTWELGDMFTQLNDIARPIVDHLDRKLEDLRSEEGPGKEYKITSLYLWMLSYIDRAVQNFEEEMTQRAVDTMDY